MSKTLKPWADTPKLTKSEIERLTPVSSSMKTLIPALADRSLDIDDLKKIILMEYDRPFLRRYIIERCFARLGRLERVAAENVLNQQYARKGN
jgi:hypothetical protein